MFGKCVPDFKFLNSVLLLIETVIKTLLGVGCENRNVKNSCNFDIASGTKVKLLLLCNVVENAALITVSLLTCC